jgi:cysteine desulfurase
MLSQRIFSKKSKGERTVYLDYAAATPLDAEVAVIMHEAEKKHFANASAIHGDAVKAAAEIQASRAKLATLIDCNPDELIFTSGGTESDNLALFGIVREAQKKGITPHIIVSAIEHSAVLEAARVLESEGVELSILPVDEDGVVQVDLLPELLKPNTVLVSVMYVNNEIGTIQPIREIAKIIRKWKKDTESMTYPYFHTDAIQAFAYLPMRIPPLGVDLCTLSSAKTYGPKGLGVLYVKRGIALAPMHVGGGHEAGRRAGTLATPLILGGVESFNKADALRDEENERLTALRDFLAKEIVQLVPTAVVTAARAKRAPHILNIQFPNIDGDTLVLYFDAHYVRVSSQSACDSESGERSHVLSALTVPDTNGAVRFSFGRSTTKKDVEYTIEVLKKILPLV